MEPQLVSLVDVLNASAKEVGQRKETDLAASLAASYASLTLASAIGVDTFDKGAHEDLFFVNTEDIRADTDNLILKLSNGFLDSGVAVTVQVSNKMGEGFSNTTSHFEVDHEKGFVKLSWSRPPDTYVKVGYTSGFTTNEVSHDYVGQPDLVETVYQQVPEWLKELAINRAILKMKVAGALTFGDNTESRSGRTAVERLVTIDSEILDAHKRFNTNAIKPL